MKKKETKIINEIPWPYHKTNYAPFMIPLKRTNETTSHYVHYRKAVKPDRLKLKEASAREVHNNNYTLISFNIRLVSIHFEQRKNPSKCPFEYASERSLIYFK